MEELKGIVSKIIFVSNDNSFCVFVLDTEFDEVVVTSSGIVPEEGDNIKVIGTWQTHKKYGQQIKAHSIVPIVPTDTKEILNFLSSNSIPGIGTKTMQNIVATFKEKTIDIILNKPDKLLVVPKIGKKTAEKIHENLKNKMELIELCLWFEKHNLPTSYAGKVFKKYGSMAIPILEKKPYSLMYEVDGIGFVIADNIARSMNFDKEDKDRIKAGLYYVLSQIINSGHCYLLREELLDKTTTLLGIEKKYISLVYQSMVAKNQLYIEEIGDEELVYTEKLYTAEKNVAKKLIEIDTFANNLSLANFHKKIAQFENLNEIRLDETQILAIKKAIENGVSIITGGPGTGKTTIIKGIIHILSSLKQNIILLAPTGRAAKRMTETCNKKAKTIHRLMVEQIQGSGEEFTGLDIENIDEIEDVDAIIVDEMSMVDISLMNYLLYMVPKGAKLILVGDENQLPAVGAGSVLKDIIQSKTVEVVSLNKIFRQDEDSMIIENAHLINKGYMPKNLSAKDFLFLEIEDNEKMAETILKLCEETLPKEGYNIFSSIQILSPMHKMEVGVSYLNKILQEKLNPKDPLKPEMEHGDRIFRLGDKVMHIKNNYQKSVFNGDSGYISDMTQDEIFVNFQDKIVSYTKEELVELTLSYAISVHKSQGSEYPVVIMPLSMSHYIMLQRNLLYTAITRAKEKVILLGQKKALESAIRNNKTKKRNTLLANRLMYEKS